MNVLGIETSCDETAAAIVCDGCRVLSNVVFSQVRLHAPYGGVVPEIASRSHVEALPRVIGEAVQRSGLGWDEIDQVAGTYGPGLASSLLVGFSAAKALAMRLDRPLCAINHLEAHIYSAFLSSGKASFNEACPFIALVVSGGHTGLIRVSALGEYELLGQTVDDAAGEAFDKGACLLGLGYPGGPRIQRAAEGGDTQAVRFPRSRPRKESLFLHGLRAEYCFSFSGLKTALLYHLRDHPADTSSTRDIAASFQESIVDSLVDRCATALGSCKTLVAGGGVSLNARLRDRLVEMGRSRGVQVLLAEPAYCGDNAAMIAGLAGAGGGLRGEEVFDLDVNPNLSVTDEVAVADASAVSRK